MSETVTDISNIRIGDVQGTGVAIGTGATATVNHTTIVTPESTYDVAGLPNPYLGLRAFTYEDRAAYGGRKRSIEEAVRKLAQPGQQRTLLFILGASGSGKSSFAQAGVAPALEAFYAQRHQQMRLAVFHPAAHPLAMLTDALAQVGLLGMDDLTRGPTANPIVLVVDQFEELFTQSQPAEREAFFDWLMALPSFAKSRMHVIATLRSDYLRELFDHKALWDTAQDGIALRAMDEDDLRLAIQQPVQVRYPNGEKRFEPALVDRLAADAGGDAALLPLLQVTLEEIWKQGHLTLASYRSLTDAIRQRADQVYGYEDYDAAVPSHPRTAEARAAVLQLFLDLVRVSDDDDRRDVRVSRQVEELGANHAGLVNDLVQARLLSMTSDSNVERVSIIHESLIHNWDLLCNAVKEQRLRLQQRARFEQALGEWTSNGQLDKYLLGGVRLAEALELQKAGDVAVRQAGAVAFVEASVRVRDQAIRRDAERRQLRYLWRAAACAAGAGLGYASGLALLAAHRGFDRFAVSIEFLSQFPMGAMVGLAIGLALWHWRDSSGARKVATTLIAAGAGSMITVFFVLSTIGLRNGAINLLPVALTGAGLGAGLGLGSSLGVEAPNTWTPLFLLPAISVVIAILLSQIHGFWIIPNYLPVALLFGVILGAATGLGLAVTPVKENN